MPIYYHFYVECRGPDGWGVPPDFKPESWTFESKHRFGEFAWAHPRRGWLELFFNRNPLFPMRMGPPDDRRDSPLLRYLDQFYNYDQNEDQLCWLPYQELLIDCWDTECVTIGSQVPARLSLLFKDGRQVFPGAALLQAGATDRELEHLRFSSFIRDPVDITFGQQRHHVSGLPPDRLVNVTWSATITEFIGEPHAGLFKGLRQYGPEQDLRILCVRG